MEKIRKKGKFWGEYILAVVGTSAVGALGLLILLGAGSGELWSAEGWKNAVHVVYPIYLLAVGSFVQALVTINYFQIYLQVFVSMGVTRRRAVCSILAVNACSALLLIGAAALFLALPDWFSPADGGRLYLLLTGGLLAAAAVFTVIGVVSVRWGKLGVLLVMLVFMGAGGSVSAGLALSVKNAGQMFVYLKNLTELLKYYPIVFAVGAAAYLLAGVFAVYSLRRMEVRS